MRTGLDIDGDIVGAARAAARRGRPGALERVSRPARRTGVGTAAAPRRGGRGGRGGRGFRPVPSVAGSCPCASRGARVTDEVVEALRDAERC
jgi:hypothetical protein